MTITFQFMDGRSKRERDCVCMCVCVRDIREMVVVEQIGP